jgi:hypothetical protein
VISAKRRQAPNLPNEIVILLLSEWTTLGDAAS